MLLAKKGGRFAAQDLKIQKVKTDAQHAVTEVKNVSNKVDAEIGTVKAENAALMQHLRDQNVQIDALTKQVQQQIAENEENKEKIDATMAEMQLHAKTAEGQVKRTQALTNTVNDLKTKLQNVDNDKIDKLCWQPASQKKNI